MRKDKSHFFVLPEQDWSHHQIQITRFDSDIFTRTLQIRSLTQNIKANGVADTVGHAVTDVASTHQDHKSPEGQSFVEGGAGRRLAVEVYECARDTSWESGGAVVGAVTRYESQW